MHTDAKLPLALLTGFLGSGKTSLLNALLKERAFANTAVIVNEFGEIGLDHLLIARGTDNGRITGPAGHGKYIWRRLGLPPLVGSRP